MSLEEPIADPNQSSKSTLATGRNHGVLLGSTAALMCPTGIVKAQAWQKSLFGAVKKGATKGQAREYAQRMYPSADLGRRKTEDRSDALCLASYATRYVWPHHEEEI